jgi:hypothetical protein
MRDALMIHTEKPHGIHRSRSERQQKRAYHDPAGSPFLEHARDLTISAGSHQLFDAHRALTPPPNQPDKRRPRFPIFRTPPAKNPGHTRPGLFSNHFTEKGCCGSRQMTLIAGLASLTAFGRRLDRARFGMRIATLKVRRTPEGRSPQLLFRLQPVLLIAPILPAVLLPKFMRATGNLFVRDRLTDLL